MFTENYKPRFLPERSFLYLRYPQEKVNKFIDIYIPFLENIEISESQKPNLATYELIGRPGNLFSYHGAKSREFKLKFNITLPNVVEYLTIYKMSYKFSPTYKTYSDNKEDERNRFYYGRKNGKNAGSDTIPFFSLSTDEYVRMLDEEGVLDNAINALDSSFTKRLQGTFVPSKKQKTESDATKLLKDAVTHVLSWVGAVRSTVLNNSTNTSLGPPAVYLTHGTIYRNIPCVCTGVNVKIKENFGYELLSLTPRVIEITMDLSENRVGDFGKFEPFDTIKGDNIAGWEAIIKYGTTDPYSNIFDEQPRNLLDYAYDIINTRSYETYNNSGITELYNEDYDTNRTGNYDTSAILERQLQEIANNRESNDPNLRREGTPDSEVAVEQYLTSMENEIGSADYKNKRTIESTTKGVGRDIPFLGRRPGRGREGFNKVWKSPDSPFYEPPKGG